MLELPRLLAKLVYNYAVLAGVISSLVYALFGWLELFTPLKHINMLSSIFCGLVISFTLILLERLKKL